MIKRQILFIDPHIEDIGTIRTAVRPEIAQHILPVSVSASRFMADITEGRRFEAIHILAHGGPGRVHFASGDWRLETLARDAEDLARLGSTLDRDGAVYLWCCETAAGDEGRAFVAALEESIAAEVYASVLPVGAASRGGTWVLTNAGRQPPLTETGVARYAGLLGPTLRISGDIPRDETQENVTYSVVDRASGQVVSSFRLPGHSTIRRFSIAVPVPEPTDLYDVGVFDASGAFVAASFAVSRISQLEPAAIGAAGARQ